MKTAWRDDEALGERDAWLLEASAGTGKTFQIASLVLRLVAEYGVELEKILVMTFTTAATAELQDRIRRRLQAAFDAADGRSPADGPDPVVVRLLALVPRDLLRQRLLLALRSFDRASISTIHGFAQRMLAEFAFDSGQDAGLTLLESAADVEARVVDDALAELWSRCDVRLVRILDGHGVNRDGLWRVAKAVSGTEAPEVTPRVVPTPQTLEEVWTPTLDRLRSLLDRVDAFRARWFEGVSLEPVVASSLGHLLTADQLAVGAAHVARWLDTDGGLSALAETKDVNANTASLRALASLPDMTEALAAEVVAGRPYKAKTSLRKKLPAEAYALVKGGGGDVDFLHAAHLRDRATGEAAAFVMDWTALKEDFDALRFSRALAPLAPFAAFARGRVEADVRARRALTFDAMIVRLAERLRDTGGPDSPLAARLRERFHAVLVDEFQDTDQAQWQLLEDAFLGHRRLVLIGDPKQAIYGFRGANVHVYVQAARKVDRSRHRTMTTNWRSDVVAVEAMNHLFREGSDAFDQAAPGASPGFDYVRVEASPGRTHGASPGLDLRLLAGFDPKTKTAHVVRRVLRHLQEEVVGWLSGRLCIDGRDTPLAPPDLAVLVNTHREAQLVRRALERVGVPVVSASTGTVLESPPAGWLCRWLEAVADARDERAARTAVTTPLGGWSAEHLAWALAFAGDVPVEGAPADIAPTAWAVWRGRLRRVADRWPAEGFSRLFDQEAAELRVFERLLGLPDGERHATDLRHVVEVCEAHVRQHRPDAGALARWLRERIAEARNGGSADGGEWTQRLESDAHAVTIDTVHVSKGLEYPVVLLPFAWSQTAREPKPFAPVRLQGAGRTRVDVSTPGSEARLTALEESHGEDRREGLRKLYVALTRGRHRTVAFWGPAGAGFTSTDHTPLARLLLRPSGTVGYPPPTPVTPELVQSRLSELAEASRGLIRVTAAFDLAEPPARWSTKTAATSTAQLVSVTDLAHLASPWARTSFSSLMPQHSRRDVEASPADDEGGATDPEAEAAPAVVPDLPGGPLLTKGGGPAYGNFVHGVLERVDFVTLDTPDGRPKLDAVASRLAVEHGASDEARDELVAHLGLILATPLDGGETDLAAGFSLRALAAADRRDEVAFDLRLGAGEDWRPGLSNGAAQLDLVCLALEREGGRTIPPTFVARLRSRFAGRSLAGILNGKIDLVFRAACTDGRRRYFIADYKTNLVGDGRAGHYTREWLASTMAGHGYYLQALLYTVALHRHLAVRLTGYDYDRDVGGWQYLFLRGMHGPDTARMPGDDRSTCLGVYADRFPRRLVEAVDAALSGQEDEREAA